MLLWLIIACFGYVQALLWPQGVVHYDISKKDYDVHSQEVIMDTLSALQREVCVKFFKTPSTHSNLTRFLYINNPDKLKDCPPRRYDYKGAVVQEQKDTTKRGHLLSAADRSFLNSHYQYECGRLTRIHPLARRTGEDEDIDNDDKEGTQMSEENVAFYRDLLWPLGVVMYGVDPDINGSDPHLQTVKRAMSVIEGGSCVVFQPSPRADVLETNNFLWFNAGGEDAPELGFRPGNQSLKLSSMAVGAPGHAAHALCALLRALGVPMVSNRHDRDNYVTINWDNVQPGKEHYLERVPEAAWIRRAPYDVTSATHAPANYMCRHCSDPTKALTVLPLQDHLWQRTLSTGRRATLSEGDMKLLNTLYGKECHKRALRDASTE